MDKEEIIRRLKNISEHAVHVTGEPPFIISLDDGIALGEAVSMLKEQEAKTGKWERQWSRPGVYANLFWWCSCCKQPTREQDAGLFYEYCPHCGAEMEKATDE